MPSWWAPKSGEQQADQPADFISSSSDSHVGITSAALGEWEDKATRDRISQLIAAGTQAPPELIRASLPQTDGLIVVGEAAPTEGLALTALDGRSVTLAELFAADARSGKATLLNFGSYT